MEPYTFTDRHGAVWEIRGPGPAWIVCTKPGKVALERDEAVAGELLRVVAELEAVRSAVGARLPAGDSFGPLTLAERVGKAILDAEAGNEYGVPALEQRIAALEDDILSGREETAAIYTRAQTLETELAEAKRLIQFHRAGRLSDSQRHAMADRELRDRVRALEAENARLRQSGEWFELSCPDCGRFLWRTNSREFAYETTHRWQCGTDPLKPCFATERRGAATVTVHAPSVPDRVLAAVREGERVRTLDEVLRGLRSEEDTQQLRAIIASVEHLRLSSCTPPPTDPPPPPR